MAALNNQEILNIYQALMEDIKRRIAAITAFQKHFQESEQFQIEYIESCYLQIRKISETLALALTAAHNQIPDFASKRFVGEWHAEKLVKNLTKLNQYGFPTPITADVTVKPIAFKALPTRFSPDHFVRIYQKCGQNLHSGSLKRVSAQNPISLNPQQVSGWAADFVDLLSNHMIVLAGHNKILTASMNNPDLGGKVKCFFAEELKFN